ncbi:MAG: RNA polymerase sigma factor RpoH [Proteobacteria bacterium]|nr:RNA polymerase sigma factor RpoH [Pseudomonadota bacterium]MCZ6894250.1 RNA polymerase sigma factor RpoH [Gammaproteobacteria bacterium]
MALNLQLPLPTGSLEAYVDAVQRIPLLSLEEEQDLARRYREHGDLDAARELVLAHLRFVVSVARRYKGYGLAHGDLIQEGNIGLMKAVKRFDPDVGVRLVSFAVHWIKAEIHEFVIKNWRIVKVATTKAQRKLFFNLRSAKKTLGWMGAEEVEDTARDFGVETRDVLTMEQRLNARDVSFDLRSDDDEDPFVPAAYLQDQRFEPSLCYEQEEAESVRTERLGEALGELDARSRDIVVSRWLLDPKMTLQKLAEKYEVSAERIRQLEKSAFKTLKNQIPDLEETIAAEPVIG